MPQNEQLFAILLQQCLLSIEDRETSNLHPRSALVRPSAKQQASKNEQQSTTVFDGKVFCFFSAARSNCCFFLVLCGEYFVSFVLQVCSLFFSNEQHHFLIREAYRCVFLAFISRVLTHLAVFAVLRHPREA